MSSWFRVARSDWGKSARLLDLGMVGSCYRNGQSILSKRALLVSGAIFFIATLLFIRFTHNQNDYIIGLFSVCLFTDVFQFPFHPNAFGPLFRKLIGVFPPFYGVIEPRWTSFGNSS